MVQNKHVSNIRKLVADHLAQEAALREELKALESKLKNDDLTRKSFEEQAQPIKDKLSTLSIDAYQRINAEKNAYYAAVDAWEAPAGDKVHDDIKVLSGLVPLALKDLEVLGQRHKNNPVMMGAIKKYAKDNNIDYYSDAVTGDMKKQGFEDICQYADSAIKVPTGAQAAMLLDDNHFVKICSPALDSSGEV